VSEGGGLVGTLDGISSDTPRFLGSCHHVVELFACHGRLALMWARAAKKQFSPFSAIPDDKIGAEN